MKKKEAVDKELFTADDGVHLSDVTQTTSLQKIYCEPIPIPPEATEVGVFRKGQVLMVPIDGAGRPYKRSAYKNNADPAGGWWAYTVTAIKSSGEIELKLAEYKAPKTGEPSSERRVPDSLRPTSNDDLAFLLEQQGR